MRNLRQFFAHRHAHASGMFAGIIFLIVVAVIAVVASSVSPIRAQGSTPTANPGDQEMPPDSSAQVVLLVILSLVVILALPGGYLLFSRTPRKVRSLLLVSTDEEARKLVIEAAKRAGYSTVAVYRYEDALDRLRQDFSVSMIVIDDSVPQYEAGMLVSMLMRLPTGIRSLILIHDSSEMGLTAPSYHAEVVVSRPLTVKALEAAIRQVGEHTAIDL